MTAKLFFRSKVPENRVNPSGVSRAHSKLSGVKEVTPITVEPPPYFKVKSMEWTNCHVPWGKIAVQEAGSSEGKVVSVRSGSVCLPPQAVRENEQAMRRRMRE